MRQVLAPAGASVTEPASRSEDEEGDHLVTGGPPRDQQSVPSQDRVDGRLDACIDAADTFWESYCGASGWDVERDTVRELAVLMLARVDGKSPVEYLDSGEDDLLRGISKRALREETATLDGFAAIVREVAA